MDLFRGAKKTTNSKKTSDAKKSTKSAKTTDAKKPKKSTTPRSKSKTKGGNFLGTVGDLVAPTGWGPFATAAGLLALDRADAALRRGTKEKKEKMKGGKKMKGGLCQEKKTGQIHQVTIGPINHTGSPTGNIYSYYTEKKINEYSKLGNEYPNWTNENQNIVIKCAENGEYYYEVNITCNGEVKTYKHLPKGARNQEIHFFKDFEAAYNYAKLPNVQKALVKLALLNKCQKKKSNS